MSNNIYEQAIADAKKLREIAEQNAKNAIIEAITPRVRELIDNELTSNTTDFTISESYDLDDSDDIVLEESAILELAREVAGSKSSSQSNELFDLLNEIKKDEDDKKECDTCGHLNKDKGDGACENSDCASHKKNKKDVEESMHHYEQYNQQEEDMNLEELLNEIKMEIDLDIEDEEIEEALKSIMPTVKFVDEDEEEGDEMDMEAAEGEEGEGEGEEGGDLEFELPDLPDFGGGEAGEEEKTEESYHLNEGLLELELRRLRKNRSADSNNETRLNEARYQKQILEEKRENRMLRGKLDEYRGAVEDLRDQLNEMNLFNAKLLYVNKLLQSKGLDAAQKKTIIESIDNAESLREVKLVYKTLSESVSKKSDTLNESKIRKLAGSSSRPTRSGGTLLNESTGQVDRWARLAGLK